MWFLARFDWEDITNMVAYILRGLFAGICKIIYPWIANLYDIFRDLGQLVYSDQFTSIYNKVSLIIGIFMVFRVTFWLLESLINPDLINDKEKNPGKIIQKVLVVVILLATTPTIFEYAFKIQNKIVSSNIIENIISTDKTLSDESTTIGRNLAANLFVNFYTPTIIETEDGEMQLNDDCSAYTGINGLHADYLRQYGKLTYLDNACLTKRIEVDNEEDKVFVIDFNGLFAAGVGIFVCWMILMYCISLGTRYIQLIYLQVVAPIPIMCYLAPSKDNMFSKWLKQCTTTYLDLFIRIAIINFAMFLCNWLLHNQDGIILNSNIKTANGMITLFLVLGLLTFAKKAPDLVQELLPKSVTKASGDFGLSLKKRTESMLGGKFAYSTLKRAPGYVAGGVVGAGIGGVMGALGGKGVGSRVMGAVTGATRGFGTGSKKGSLIKNIGEVKKNQAAQNSKLQQWRINAGKGDNEANTFGDWWSRQTTSGKKAMGFETEGQYLDRANKSAQAASNAYKSMKDESITKVLENNASRNSGTRATAFGVTGTLLERDQRRKTAANALAENDKDKLLSTADGQSKLETYLTGTGNAWAVANGINSTSLSTLTDAQKEDLADEYIRNLQRESNEAEEDYLDQEKKFAFIYEMEQAAGIKRDSITGDITNIGSGINENFVNQLESINSFIKQFDETYGITTGDNPLFQNGTKEFDANAIAQKIRDAEQGDQVAMSELTSIYEDYNKIKTLMGRVAKVEGDYPALKAKANDQFNK